MLRWLTYGDFVGRPGERFDLAVAQGPTVSLELIEATQGSQPVGQEPDGMRYESVFG